MSKAPIRVAIVDDEPAVRTALARFLDASSFETKTYGSAREFMIPFCGGEPECLVVDVHMPDFTGLICSAISTVSTRTFLRSPPAASDDAGIGSGGVGAKAPDKTVAWPNTINAIRSAIRDTTPDLTLNTEEKEVVKPLRWNFWRHGWNARLTFALPRSPAPSARRMTANRSPAPLDVRTGRGGGRVTCS